MKVRLKIASIIASIALFAPVSAVKADLVFTYTSGPLTTAYGPDGPGGDGNYITAVINVACISLCQGSTYNNDGLTLLSYEMTAYNHSIYSYTIPLFSLSSTSPLNDSAVYQPYLAYDGINVTNFSFNLENCGPGGACDTSIYLIQNDQYNASVSTGQYSVYAGSPIYRGALSGLGVIPSGQWTVVATPLPGALLLFTSALGVLGLFCWRKKAGR